MNNEEKKEPEPKFRVSLEETKDQVKKFTSASSASLHQSLSRSFKKIKKIGLFALEKTADYAQKRKEEKKSK